jgi:hypothetical protein
MNQSRRDLLRKAAYAAPAIMTMSAMPFSAATGSTYGPGDDTSGVKKPNKPNKPNKPKNP